MPSWLISRPYGLIFAFCTLITPFKTIWPNFIIVYTTDSFSTYLKYYFFLFYILYPINSFQDYMTLFLHFVFKLLLSRPYDLMLYCVPNWLLSRPYDLILSLCTQLTPFSTYLKYYFLFYILYPIDSFQDHLP